MQRTDKEVKNTVTDLNFKSRRSEYICLTFDVSHLQKKRAAARKCTVYAVTMVFIVCIIILASFFCSVGSNPLPASDDFMTARAKLIDSELCMRLGNNIVLNDKEKILNQFIMKEKRRVMENSRLNRTIYVPAVSFFLSKTEIEASPIFKIIKEMPKGAGLHLHDLAIASIDWIVHNATYRDNVYMCVDQEMFIQLSVFQTPPANPGCEWKLVKSERNASSNKTDFDLSLKRNISMLSSDPLTMYPSVDLVWDRFNKYFSQVMKLLFYAPIMRDYYRQALTEFRADNVQYIELRGQLAGFYDLDGIIHDAEFGLNLYKNVTEEFVRDNPNFSGAKIIMSGLRVKNSTDILGEIKTAMNLYSKYPNFLVGYDLVGQEDPNNPLSYYLDALIYPSRQNPPFHLPYFFHAAETKWQGTDVDYNLVDALLLNTTRIGHGFGLVKHPKLVEMVKAKKVAIEVSPLSNQLLGLVSDLRNHAMAPLISQDIPLVISSDDPATWEALPMSHDIYVAFMDLTGEDADLQVLKQFAINSLEYSVMTSTEKTAALKLWQSKWDTFVDAMITTWNLKADTTTNDPGTRVCPKVNPTSFPEVTPTSCPKVNPSSSVNGLHVTLVIYIMLLHRFVFL